MPWNKSLELIVVILNSLFLSIIWFSNEDWNIHSESWCYSWLFIGLIHVRGLLEFVWFVDLHKVLVTDSSSVFISFSSGFINNVIMFLCAVVCYKNLVVLKKEDKVLIVWCLLEYHSGKAVKYLCGWGIMACICRINILVMGGVSNEIFHCSFEMKIIEWN